MKGYILCIRILYTLAGLLGILFFPSWIIFIVASVGFFLFPRYIEGIILCIIMDGLYSFPGSIPHPGIYSVTSIIIFIIVFYLRKKLTWYTSS